MATVALGLLTAVLVINEVCYDPPGADGGAEFVELWNAGDDTARVDGLALEFANGADSPPAWSVQWRAEQTVVVPPRHTFLVADRGWEGPPAAAEASLALQNGPDALRLVAAGEVLDLVGWGELAWPQLSEGAPAADVAGLAIARRPDGRDTDDNATDFQAADPTPGTPNWRDFAPEVTAIVWSPPSLPRAGADCTAAVEVANRGLRTLAAARLELRGPGVGSVALPAVPPDGAVLVEVSLHAAHAGNWPATVAVSTGVDTLIQPVGRFQVGLAAVHLTEVMARPLMGGEWCEVVNRDSVPRSLDGLAVRDEDGSWRALPDADLAPGDCQVVVQDVADFEAWLEDLASAGAGPRCVVRPPAACGGWPSLNNTAPGDRGYADRLYLGDAAGNVLDHVTVGAGDGEALAGRSLERGADGRWRPATAAAGATPGCPPPAPAATAAGELRVEPNPFDPGRGEGAVRLQFRLPTDVSGWELRVYDLWGQPIRELGGDDLGPGWREAVWDGRDDGGVRVPDGGYVAVLLWRTPAGSVRPAHRRLVVVRTSAS